MKSPNILYLHLHDAGRWIEPYGFFALTPNFSRLAASGTTFRQAFCCGPTCSPSRAALLTGQSPHVAGMLGLAHLGWKLAYPERTFVHFFAQNGYETRLEGVSHVMPHDQTSAIGYESIARDEKSPYERAAAFLQSRAALPESEKRPFLLDVGSCEPHRSGEGFGVTDGTFDPRFAPAIPGLPDGEITRRDIADYAAAVQKSDAGLGHVLEALRASGEAENTLVFVTTDHGPAFPGSKCSLRDTGTGVFLIVKGFDFQDGKVVDALVSHLDIFPTLCEIAHLPRPDWLEGESLLPLVRGEKTEIHDELFAEVTFHSGWEPKRAVRTRQWKYIRNFLQNDFALPVLPNCDDSPSKSLWAETGGDKTPVVSEELYDLRLDPQENRNVAAQNPEFSAQMRARLEAWMKKTADPLLGESLAVPPDIRVAPLGATKPGSHAPISESFPDYDPQKWPAKRP